MLRKTAIIVFLLVLSACGPSIRIDPSIAGTGPPRKVMLLPVIVTTDMSREHADYIRRVVRSELASKNYLLLAEDIVAEACSSAACPEEKMLLDSYDADGAFALSISSLRRTNFVAGFYNAISGGLLLRGSASNELVSVKAQASERGGLLFNTGQVVQGLASTIGNLEEDSSVRLLGAKFAKKVTAPVPEPGRTNQAFEIPAQWQVRARSLRADLYEICADAPAGLIANVVLKQSRSNLRRSGSAYCGNYLFNSENISSADLLVEIRSPFGAAAQKPIRLNAYASTPR